MKKRNLNWYFFRLYLLSLITLMLIKTKGTIQLSSTILGIRSDYFIHACLFIPFMGLKWFSNRFNLNFSSVVYSYGFGIAFAALCESLHLLVPYRTFSIYDFFANSVGLTIGYLFLIVIAPFFMAHKSS
jgi:hypothetical protein